MKTLYTFLFMLGLFPTYVHAYSSTQIFEIDAGLMGPAEGKIAYTADSDSYDISASVTARGLIEKLYGYEGRFHAKGDVKNDKPVASLYEYVSVAGGNERRKTVIMDKHGVPQQRLTLRKGRNKNVALQPPAFDFDAPDMLSVFFALVKQFQTRRFCDLRQTVFDGKKHYIVSFTDQGKTTPDDLKIRPTGDVWQCAMQIRPLDEEDEDLLWKTTAKTPILFWIVKDQKNNLPYIAKIQIDSTPVGRIKAYNIDNQISEE